MNTSVEKGYVKYAWIIFFVFGFLTVIAAVQYRKGEKWAWYTCWILPVLLVIQLANSRGGFGWQADLIGLLIVLAGLFLPYRKFFTKQQVTP